MLITKKDYEDDGGMIICLPKNFTICLYCMGEVLVPSFSSSAWEDRHFCKDVQRLKTYKN
jgi:hypothetical protein